MKKTAQPDMLEIIFAHKNKRYGAYRLRREYPEYLMRAFFSGILLIFSGSFLIKVWPRSIADKSIVPICCMCQPPTLIHFEKVYKPQVPKPANLALFPKLSRSVRQFTPPVILPNEIVEYLQQELDNKEDLEKLAPIGKTSQGSKYQSACEEEENWHPVCTFESTELDIIEETATDSVMEIINVNKLPSFPGGEAELQQFLGDNIVYPSIACENHIQGTAVLNFVIGKDGTISNIQILKDPGGGCGKEAVRVVQSMPKWSPGEANGNAVKVKFTLPVRFRLQ